MPSENANFVLCTHRDHFRCSSFIDFYIADYNKVN